jgi:hypothetical protein
MHTKQVTPMKNQTRSTDQPPTGMSPDKPAVVDSSTTFGVNTRAQILGQGQTSESALIDFPIQGSAQIKAPGPVSQVDPNPPSTTVDDQRGQAQRISSEEMKRLSSLFVDTQLCWVSDADDASLARTAELGAAFCVFRSGRPIVAGPGLHTPAHPRSTERTVQGGE